MIESAHARAQKQRRVIPPLIEMWLLDYGAEQHDHMGATIYYFDRQAKRNIERSVGRVGVTKLKSFMNSYILVADGVLVTAGRRYKRINRH